MDALFSYIASRKSFNRCDVVLIENMLCDVDSIVDQMTKEEVDACMQKVGKTQVALAKVKRDLTVQSPPGSYNSARSNLVDRLEFFVAVHASLSRALHKERS